MSYLLLAAIGLCEHCGTLLNIEGMPAEAMGADWPCPKCKKNTTSASFGYKEVSKGKWEKIRWVGKIDGKLGWVTEKPTSSFRVGELEIWIESPCMFY